MESNTKNIILKDLKQNLLAKFDLNLLVLFGSQASGKENENSDFDILVVLNKMNSTKDVSQIMDICYAIDLKYNMLLDAHILTKADLNSLRGRQPIFVNALKNGIYA